MDMRLGPLDAAKTEVYKGKITNAYRTMKHGLLQGLTAPIVMGMSQYLNMFL